MLLGSLRIDGVEIAKIKMPETHKEIRYGQYLDFAMITTDINDWLVKQMNEKRNYGNQYRVKLAYATSTIYDVDPKLLLNLTYEGIEFLESAYIRINNLITSFEPKENAGKFEVTSRDNITYEYQIPEITQAIFRGTNNLPPFTLQQLVEISETERILDDQIKKIDSEQKDVIDFKGNVISKAMQKSHQTFQNTIKKIVLCVTPYHKIPTDHTYDVWMEDEMNKMKDISMVDALNTIFFLKSIPNVFGTLIELDTTLSILKSHVIEMNQLNNMVNESEKLMIGQNAYEI